MEEIGRSLSSRFSDQVASNSEKTALIFLQNGEEESECLSYAELDDRARAIGAYLARHGKTNDRVLLLYPSATEYVAAFLGCLYAGMVAIPAYPPRNNHHAERLLKIIDNAGASLVLTSVRLAPDIADKLADRLPADGHIIGIESLVHRAPADFRSVAAGPDTLAYLQYTSGSTGSPKGVMITHGNLLHNLEMYRVSAKLRADEVHVSWLPIFHDLRLVTGILQSLYLGATCLLMPPVAFIQKPIRWFKALSKYSGAVSGGPNFAYNLCIDKTTAEEREGIRLDNWRVALNGAEPVRADTIRRFSTEFHRLGFNPRSFFPGYGLAEATLMVTVNSDDALPVITGFDTDELEQGHALENSKAGQSRPLVACGRPWLEQEIVIADTSAFTSLPEDRVGEIWIKGDSVARGYWNKEKESREAFRAKLAGSGEGSFLRTGDLGFLHKGQLYVAGRLKDLIVIRGANHYPQDIELTIEQIHPALRKGYGAAFSIEKQGEEQLVVAQEVERSRRKEIPSAQIIDKIRTLIAVEHGIEPYAVVLLKEERLAAQDEASLSRFVEMGQYMIGMDYSGWANTLLSFEYAVEEVRDSSDLLDVTERSRRTFVMAERTFLRERLRASAYWYGLGEEGDIYRAEMDYAWSDKLRIVFGAIEYAGDDPENELYPYRNSDRVYVRMRYSFSS